MGHDLKIGLPFADFYLANGWFLGHDQSRLAKRRRALLESNSPRNSQLETHRNDEVAGAVWIPYRMGIEIWSLFILKYFLLYLDMLRYAVVKRESPPSGCTDVLSLIERKRTPRIPLTVTCRMAVRPYFVSR